MSTPAVMAIVKVSPRAKELYLLSGELSRMWLDEKQYEALDIMLALSMRSELAFVAALIAHSLITMDEEDLFADFCVAMMKLQSKVAP